MLYSCDLLLISILHQRAGIEGEKMPLQWWVWWWVKKGWVQAAGWGQSLSSLQCSDTAGWVKGRASGLCNACATFFQTFSSRTGAGRKPSGNWLTEVYLENSHWNWSDDHVADCWQPEHGCLEGLVSGLHWTCERLVLISLSSHCYISFYCVLLYSCMNCCSLPAQWACLVQLQVVGWLIRRSEPRPYSFRGGGLEQRPLQAYESVHEPTQEADGSAGWKGTRTKEESQTPVDCCWCQWPVTCYSTETWESGGTAGSHQRLWEGHQSTEWFQGTFLITVRLSRVFCNTLLLLLLRYALCAVWC